MKSSKKYSSAILQIDGVQNYEIPNGIKTTFNLYFYILIGVIIVLLIVILIIVIIVIRILKNKKGSAISSRKSNRSSYW